LCAVVILDIVHFVIWNLTTVNSGKVQKIYLKVSLRKTAKKIDNKRNHFTVIQLHMLMNMKSLCC